MDRTFLSGEGRSGCQVLPGRDLGKGTLHLPPAQGLQMCQGHTWTDLALAVPLGRWRIPHSFEEEEEIVPLPPKQQQREDSLPAQRGAGTALGHPGGKGLPRQLPARGLESVTGRKVGLRLSSSKPPPTPASHIRLGLQKEEDLGVGVGALRLPADKLRFPGVLWSPEGDPRDQLGGWASESLAGPSPCDLGVCTCTTRAGCSTARGIQR